RGCPVMVVNPSVPAKSVPEFIAYAKANPGKINMGSAGIGSVTHICGELFKILSGVNLVHVPYRGAGPALIDLLGGQDNPPCCLREMPTESGSQRWPLPGIPDGEAAGKPRGRLSRPAKRALGPRCGLAERRREERGRASRPVVQGSQIGCA